jgi:uncharacterized protein (DUF58 family)
MLSRLGVQPLFIGTGLLLSALAMANVTLLAIAAIPLLLIVSVGFLRPPTVKDAKISVDSTRLYVGQALRVRVQADLNPGTGPIDVALLLPPSCFLLEGSNLQHKWCTPGDRRIEFEFVARCDRRGVHPIGGLQFEATHPTLLGATQNGIVGAAVDVRVRPRWARLRRMRSRRLRSKSPIPELDLARSGVQTTEFEDIRQYQWGDSPRSVNWKASARAMAISGEGRLLVNKYEHEGKRMVWLFLDGSYQALVGTSLDNAFERRLEAAYTLGRGYSVGFSLFNSEALTTLLPDLSSKQKTKILELVHNLGPTDSAKTLLESVENAKPYMMPRKTLTFVVSSLGQSAEPLEGGLRRLRSHLGHRQGRVPVVLIHINPYGLVPNAERYGLARMTALYQRPAVRALQGLGVFCIEWDPAKKSLATMIRRIAP